MNDDRPDPDALLARVQADDVRARQGKLKIFFGYAAGVGKTYAMLEAARRAQSAGKDVVIGYVEPHGRRETEALLVGLPALSHKELEYRGVTLHEFDVDAALARKPELLLVDELAHTNAEGSRHAKRWQDVEELLEAGIDVWTSLNVQHIDSLNDVIGKVTGVSVRETIPDRVFERADDLELVDITPEELVDRLNAGKIYIPGQVQRAIDSFFQKGNLAALRELSFRQAAQRVHSDVELARRERAAGHPWPTAERLLVCVGPSPTTARVIRTAKRMAAALHGTWTAVSVETSGAGDNPTIQARIAEHFRLAERLGAENVTLTGEQVAETILEFARARNVTKILIGKTHEPRWRRWFGRGVVEQLLENSGEIDVYVIHGVAGEAIGAAPPKNRATVQRQPYFYAAGWVATAGLLAALLHQLKSSEANLVMVFLAAVAFVAYRYGRGPAIFSAIASVLVFDFCFVPPHLTLAVSDTQYLFTFAIMLAIGLVISALTARLRRQVERGQAREQSLAALYHLGKQLSSLSGDIFIVSAAGKQLAAIFGGEAVVYLRGDAGRVEPAFGGETETARHPVTKLAAQWVADNDQTAGAGTDTLPNAIALVVPLTGSQRTLGAVAVRATDERKLLQPEQRQLLEACVGQIALALERDQMAISAAEARIQAEAEQVRSSLLSGVSHDLKTPLAAVAGAASSLLTAPQSDETTRRQLLETISDEALRLNRLLENILEMSRLDSGAAAPNRQWNVLEEIVGSAVHRTRGVLGQRRIVTQLPADLPLIFVDGLLWEQLFVNLLENFARYTPETAELTLTAKRVERRLLVIVSDNGPGLPPGAEERVFDKFYRGVANDSGRGSGLGLAICRAIAKVHGGTLTAANLPTGGAEFTLTLPLIVEPPQVFVE